MLKMIFSEQPNSYSRRFDLFIQALILLSIICFTIGTLDNLTTAQERILYILDIIIVIIFSIEYILRILFTERRFQYVFGFWGIIDLLAILPFYLTFAIDLRSIRIVRFLRVFRALKLLKYSSAIRRLKQAIFESKEEIFLFLFMALMLIYLSAVGIYYFESEAQPDKFRSVFDGLWWSIATLTTVGYGDVYPITSGGRFFTALILLLGLAIVAIPSGILASSLTHVKKEEARGEGK